MRLILINIKISHDSLSPKEAIMKTYYLPVISIIVSLLVAGCRGFYDGHMGEYGNMMGYYGHGGVFMWILIVVIIGAVAYLIIQNSKNRALGGPIMESHLDILKKRYAKGEISKEEFQNMKKDLE
jgi:putative membrane protein